MITPIYKREIYKASDIVNAFKLVYIYEYILELQKGNRKVRIQEVKPWKSFK